MTPEQKIRLLELKLNGLRKNYLALKKEQKILILLLKRVRRHVLDAEEFLFDTKMECQRRSQEMASCRDDIHEKLIGINKKSHYL